MAFEYCAFWLPRRGNTRAEYEDAVAADSSTGLFAVADGASESAFARLWAGLLVDNFVRQPPGDLDAWPDRLVAVQSQWLAAVGSEPLPYYIKPKFQQGAFAAFLGLRLVETADRTFGWQAVAVGDACLFHTRQSQCAGETPAPQSHLLQAFPLGRAAEFNNYPGLVGSRAAPEEVREKLVLRANGSGQAGDRLWLMTDALAHCCLDACESGGDPWDEMESLLTPAGSDESPAFAAWIEQLRDAGRLHNDDVTLLAIKLQLEPAT